MKPVLALKVFFFFILAVSIISSCNNNEIEELEKKIEELEAQLDNKDSVLLSDLEIINQVSMDAMAELGITNILGTLTIRNCVDLSPLAGLRSVDRLILEMPIGLNSLEGLNDLSAANFLEFFFNGNSNLDLSALEGLETVDEISFWGTVPSVSFFNSIKDLRSLYIVNDASDLVLSGFESLESIDYMYIDNIRGNLTIEGFNKLQSITDLNLSSNMVNISGFANVEELNNLILVGDALQFSGLNEVTSINYLDLNGNTIDITGLNKIKSVRGLGVFAEGSVSGLNELETIDEYLQLYIESPNSFLSALTAVGTLSLYSYSMESSITSFADLGLVNLQSIGGLTIDHYSIESLEGIPFANSSLDQLMIYNSPKLDNLTALLTYTGSIDNVELYSTYLTSLDGFDNVVQINTLSAYGNRQLGNWCAIKGIFDSIPSNQRSIIDNLVNPENADDITGCE